MASHPRTGRRPAARKKKSPRAARAPRQTIQYPVVTFWFVRGRPFQWHGRNSCLRHTQVVSEVTEDIRYDDAWWSASWMNRRYHTEVPYPSWRGEIPAKQLWVPEGL